ncbi:hypothetical protein MPSEU_000475000 [Mayamaea pseudoterrestris]|nr:hypothetical protein MPSEU_000475000 [Mayamaea pseudoterrestris]
MSFKLFLAACHKSIFYSELCIHYIHITMSRSNQVKNRAAASIQITSEQIVREASDRQQDVVVEPVVKIHDREEYQAHLSERRKHYEDNIRYRREDMGNWVKYARFEEDNKEFERARSVFERALEVDHRSSELWLRYAEFEMRNEFVNHARNILDRAVQILPRVDFLWYKYVFLEEMVGDIPKCRTVFERWMQWNPDDNAYLSYTRFETRCGHLDRAEVVMRRYVNTYTSARAMLRFAKWAEFEAMNVSLARQIFESCLSELEPEESRQARVFKQFASFEERQGEPERARILYKHAVKLLKLGDGQMSMDERAELSEHEKSKREDLYKSYVAFEKKHGDREIIEDVILSKQRAQYKAVLNDNPYDYDTWFDLAKVEEERGDFDSVRATYSRAVLNMPLSDQKEHWKRYIYLWIFLAVFEEVVAHNSEAATKVYAQCLATIPHNSFSFAKIWVLAAKLFVRRRDLAAARKLLGRAIGLCAKEKIFTEYIALELALGEIDRCRMLYGNYIKSFAHVCKAWTSYANLEQSLGETDRARSIYELAIAQTSLDMPELLWKCYIDFEIEEKEAEKARSLFQRLIETTGHVKAWISFAQFETSPLGRGIKSAREEFIKAYEQLKRENLSEERVLLLDAWRVMEKSHGDTEHLSIVEAKMPRRIKRKRMQENEQGIDLGWEEYFDYQFPDDETATAGNFKILEMAAKWKAQQMEAVDSDSNDDDD